MSALLSTAASQLDRLVLIDVPSGPAGHTLDPVGALAWSTAVLPAVTDPELRRAAAVYYPGLLVPDPLGGLTAPLRVLPPSGHVAGVISRLDRERGAFWTPANVALEEAVDLDPALTEPEQDVAFGANLNLLRCAPGRGLQVWGARTLDATPAHVSYIAHRRLLHRLVRAVHQVADAARLRRQRPGAEAEPGPRGDLRAAGGVPSRGTGRDPPARGIPGGLRRHEQPARGRSRTGRVRHRRRPGGADGVHPPEADRQPAEPGGGDRGVSMPEDPLTGYRFVITLDPGDAYLPRPQADQVPLIAAGAFSEVTGLSGELEVTAYAEGGVNDYVHQLPVRHSWGRITLRRGVVRDPGLWSWYEAGLTQSLGARRNGAIVLMTPAGTRAVAWEFRAGLAAKWTGPDLHAGQDAVAVESLEVAHEGLTRVLESAPGDA